MNTTLLENIGLTRSEIAVYLALLELGSTTTGKIVDKSKASSSKIYEILDRLMQKGLVSYIIKSGTKYFEAAPPERILDYMEEKENKIIEQKSELKKLLPELELKRKLSKYKTEATIFKGVKGGETAFKYAVNCMKKGDEWLAFVITFNNINYFHTITKIHKGRVKKGLKARLIMNERHRQLSKERGEIPFTETKFVPDEQQTPTIVNIIGDITIINIMTEDVTVFMIENKEVAESFRLQFEKLWNQETYVVKGFDAIFRIFDEMIESGHCDFIGARGYLMDHKPDYIKKWVKKGIERGFTMRNIVDPGVKGHIITTFSFAKTKYTLEKEFSRLSVFWIYGGKVVIANWSGKEPTAVVIENKETYKMYKEQFELLWNK